MDTLPDIVPRLPREESWHRDVPRTEALEWLRAGWRDFKTERTNSLLYGGLVFVISLIVIGGMLFLGMDYLLFPALSAFMVFGPALAIGLYEKSRRLAAGEPVTLSDMVFVRPKSGYQVLYAGVMLCLLVVLWMRAAVLLYALFFGMVPFGGMGSILTTLFTTSEGWGLLFVGSLVGGLFAALSFSISAFSIPMMLDRELDAFTAMARSMAIVSNNLPIMLSWGAIVLSLFVFSVITGLLGLVIAFPVLGHATWHAYKTMCPPPK